MLIVDTSVWIDHFRNSNSELISALESGIVVMHPHIIGEISLGNIKQRDLVLNLLMDLPVAEVANESEVFDFIENNRLYGIGIGYVDVHLLASACLSNCLLWTLDKSLSSAASKLKILSVRKSKNN